MFRRITLSAVAVFALVSVGLARQTPPLADLKTTPEATDYKSTSTYDDVVRFMKAVDAASPNVFYVAYGKTYDGREMPMAVVGTGLKDGSAASVLATNRLRVHIQGNIHAGEVEGKEAAQVLLRELAQGKHNDWLRSMVFLITPIFNADGNEKFALTNRQRQNGPINGMGTRQTSQGLNVNRDFMKLETPEGRAFVKLWNDYDPQVGYDLHTSDGSTHGYYLTYAPPLNPATATAIMANMRDEWFPFVTKEVKAKHGWDTFYYGNVGGRPGAPRGGGPGGGGAPGGGAGRGAGGGAAAGGAAGGGAAGGGAAAGAGAGRAGGGAAGAGAAGAPPQGGNRGGARPCAPPEKPTPTGAHAAVPGPATPADPMRWWNSFEALPRYHNSYVGMRNRFALLSEAYAYATFEDRIKATNYFMEESLNYAMQNADKLKKIAADADRETIVGKELSTRSAINGDDNVGTVTILMGEVEDEKNPNNDACMNRRKDVLKAETMGNGMWFKATATETVGSEYYIPATAEKAIELLRAHGVQMRQLTQPVTGVDHFVLASNTARPAGTAMNMDTGTHGLRTITGTWEAASGATVPAGSYAVAMNQKLARLAFYLIAPTSDDGLATWNFLDDFLGADAKEYPIYRKR